MGLKVPASLRLEHVQLREQIYALAKQNNDLGAASHTVMEIFYMHAIKEEERVFPALDALPLLAAGKITDSMRLLKGIADEMKAGLYEELLEDHKAIVEPLNDIARSARDQGRMEFVEFAERFILHAQMEEEMLYPAALITAEYFQLLMQCRTDTA